MKWLAVFIGILLLVGSASAVTYSYNSEYPPVQNISYVNATSRTDVNFYPYFATDPTKSLTGTSAGTSWQSVASTVTNQRFHIDLGSAKSITKIYYENFHHSGTETDRSAQNFVFQGSNISGSFLNRTYSNDTGWTTLTTNISALVQHSASDAVDPHYIAVTNPGSFRYYAFKFTDNYGDAVYMGVRRVELQSLISWEYSTPGTYYWECPTGITNITLEIVGGGGSGRGGWDTGTYYYSGDGGSTGGSQTISKIVVTPGTNYTIVVGAGGTTSAYGTASNNGGLSSGFGYSKSGGIGGATLLVSAGGDGDTGVFSTTRYAINGTSHSPFTAGVSGLGYGAGGGGGTADNVDKNTAGGAGADGLVRITIYGAGESNVPDFSASPTTGQSGTLIHFTDLSVINEATSLTYYWDFGDGQTSNSTGDINHVYAYIGSYSPSLTLTSAGGIITEEKEAYINIIAEQPINFSLSTQPVSVQFHTQTFFGAPITNANISALGITTSTGNWDWVVTLLGIPLNEVGINGTQMYQGTDSLGNAEFLMIPSAKYNVTTTKTGYSFPIFYVSPHDKSYTLVAALNSSEVFGVPSGHSNISVSVNGTRLNNTHARINLTFLDTAGSVTSGNITISRDNTTVGGAKVSVATVNITNSSFTNSTILAIASTGGTFTVHANATSSLETAPVVKDYTVSFAGIPITIPGFSPSLLMLMALGIIVLTGLLGTALTSPPISVIICLEAWIFYALGWFQPIIDRAGSSTTILLTFSFATVLAVLWNIREGRRAER